MQPAAVGGGRREPAAHWRRSVREKACSMHAGHAVLGMLCPLCVLCVLTVAPSRITMSLPWRYSCAQVAAHTHAAGRNLL